MVDLLHAENQVKCVANFDELLTTPFYDKVNAVCWQRNLIGNFSEIVEKITIKENVKELNLDELRELDLSKNGILARKILLNDFKILEFHGAKPTLNIIKNYERDTVFPFLPTDVYSFHVDRSPIAIDTFCVACELGNISLGAP